MKHFGLLAIALLLWSSSSIAQPGFSWGVGANVSFPSSDLGDLASTGYGGEAMVKFGLIPLLDLTGAVEYISFSKADVGMNVESSASAWGYMVGARMNVLVIAYAGLELGGYSFSTTLEAPSLPDADGSTSQIFLAPLVGVKLGMFDAGVRYVFADNLNFVSVRAMIWF